MFLLLEESSFLVKNKDFIINLKWPLYNLKLKTILFSSKYLFWNFTMLMVFFPKIGIKNMDESNKIIIN